MCLVMIGTLTSRRSRTGCGRPLPRTVPSGCSATPDIPLPPPFPRTDVSHRTRRRTRAVDDPSVAHRAPAHPAHLAGGAPHPGDGHSSHVDRRAVAGTVGTAEGRRGGRRADRRPPLHAHGRHAGGADGDRRPVGGQRRGRGRTARPARGHGPGGGRVPPAGGRSLEVLRGGHPAARQTGRVPPARGHPQRRRRQHARLLLRGDRQGHPGVPAGVQPRGGRRTRPGEPARGGDAPGHRDGGARGHRPGPGRALRGTELRRLRPVRQFPGSPAVPARGVHRAPPLGGGRAVLRAGRRLRGLADEDAHRERGPLRTQGHRLGHQGARRGRRLVVRALQLLRR